MTVAAMPVAAAGAPPVVVAVTRQRGAPTAPAEPDLDGIALTEPHHEFLDLVADQFLALEQRVADAVDDRALLQQQRARSVAALVEQRVDLFAALAVGQDGRDRVAVAERSAAHRG